MLTSESSVSEPGTAPAMEPLGEDARSLLPGLAACSCDAPLPASWGKRARTSIVSGSQEERRNRRQSATAHARPCAYRQRPCRPRLQHVSGRLGALFLRVIEGGLAFQALLLNQGLDKVIAPLQKKRAGMGRRGMAWPDETRAHIG